MKKCPKCGNASYDGAPVCGNCGYTFPKPKVTAPKEESIFEKEPKVKKEDKSNESTIEIIKENKLVIGAILLITLIVICGIVLTGSNNNKNATISGDSNNYNDGAFSFTHPEGWQEANESDEDHSGAKFFRDENNTLIEYYNVTSEAASLKEINQERIYAAQERGDYIETVETITVADKNASNMVFETVDGSYLRYVTMLNDGELHVFKITGNSLNAVNSPDIQSTIESSNLI